MSASHDNIIIDYGSAYTKAGFSGEEYPKSVVQTSSIPKIQINPSSQEIKKKLIKEIVSSNNISIFEGGLINDWDYFENYLSYLFNNELKVNPDEYNLFLTEPPHNTKKNRAKTYEIIFETFNNKSAYISTQCVLCVFAAGKTSGMSVDFGENFIHFMPIYEGYGITNPLIQMNLGGKDLNEYLIKVLSEKGISMNLNDHNKYLTEIKEKYTYISMEYENDLQNFSKKNDSEKEYQMPDGSIIRLGSERFRCPEPLFKPNLIGRNFEGICENINKSLISLELKKEDDDEEKIKKELYSNIILSGGSSMFPYLPERLASEITKLSGLNYCDVIAIPERKYSAWIGGSILSSLSIFQSLWITKDDYDEGGEQIFYNKIF